MDERHFHDKMEGLRRGDERGMLLFLMEVTVENLIQLDHIHKHMEHIMADIQAIKDGFAAMDTKLDAINTAVQALQAAIAASAAGSDAAVSAALDDVVTAQTEASTHLDALSATAGVTPPPAAGRRR